MLLEKTGNLFGTPALFQVLHQCHLETCPRTDRNCRRYWPFISN